MDDKLDGFESMRAYHEIPEFYKVIPMFNRAGRLCNFGAGIEPPVQVPAAEWERFNRLAGRQHEVVDGVVVFNPDLEPCMPDDDADGGADHA